MTTTSDLVKRLREMRWAGIQMCNEAADRLEALEAEVARLREARIAALEEAASVAEQMGGSDEIDIAMAIRALKGRAT